MGLKLSTDGPDEHKIPISNTNASICASNFNVTFDLIPFAGIVPEICGLAESEPVELGSIQAVVCIMARSAGRNLCKHGVVPKKQPRRSMVDHEI